MSRPVSKNKKVHQLLQAKRKELLINYIGKIHDENGSSISEEHTELSIPQFKKPDIPKFEPIQVPKLEPVKQDTTLDDFEREYQAFIENLKKEKEKKELKEELKAYCREYINELFGIETPNENKQEEPVEETKVADISNLEGNNVIKETKSLDEEYADFINHLKQSKKENNNE